MEFGEWLRKVTDDTIPVIARKVGLSPRTLQHQVRNDIMNIENVVKIAEAYSINPVRELIDLGYISSAWEKVPDIEGALRLATDSQLTDEILRRLEAGSKAYRRPVDELIEERAKKGNNGNTGESIKDTKPHAVSSFDPDHDAPFYDPETMAAYPRHEIIPPDDQFDI